MAALPGMKVLCPAGKSELTAVFNDNKDTTQPIYFRIGRESGVTLTPEGLSLAHPAWMVRDGRHANLICSGAILEKGLQAADTLAKEGFSVRLISAPVIHPFPAETFAALLNGGPVVSVIEAYPGNPLEVGLMTLLLEQGGRGYKAINIAQTFPKIAANHDTLRERGGINEPAIANAIRTLCRQRHAR